MQGSVLQGVKLDPASPAGRPWRRLKNFLMPANAGDLTYSVAEGKAARQPEAERRSDQRRRTRLRSGKVVHLDNAFIVECRIRERSEEGARLQLARNVEVPDRIGLFDDAERSIKTAEIIWRGPSRQRGASSILSSSRAAHTCRTRRRSDSARSSPPMD